MNQPASITVDGVDFTLLPVPQQVIEAEWTVRVAMVADTVEELLTAECRDQACQNMLASVRRRAINPRGGGWAVGSLPVDWPTWPDLLAERVADEVAAKVREINGHVAIFALIDLADLESQEPPR